MDNAKLKKKKLEKILARKGRRDMFRSKKPDDHIVETNNDDDDRELENQKYFEP